MSRQIKPLSLVAALTVLPALLVATPSAVAAPEPTGASAPNAAGFTRTALVDSDLADPFELAVTPDGRVLYAQRTGELKIIDQETREVTTAYDFDYPLEFTTQSDGLLGLALDPAFAKNHQLYVMHSDKAEKRVDVSRFTLNGDRLDPASQKVLLSIPTWRGEGRANVHMGGSLAFDSKGNLYAATGDNTDPFESDGFSPTDERDGRHAWDAQSTAANTNDLRGKVLRIKPTKGGTYTVPKGNLFRKGEKKTRPEIYAMGFRNPFRISVDPATDALMVGDYGPDSREANPDRGPAGIVEYNLISKAGNMGWPYCVGNNIPFNDHDFAAGTSGGKFDCAAPVNDSPNNTGRTQLPPATAAQVWYSYAASAEFPQLGSGGGGPMGGPAYDFDPDLDSATKFPESYDGKWFNYELTRKWFKTFSYADGELQSIDPVFEGMSWIQPFDAAFGPDGSLYVIDFGEGSGVGRGSTNTNAGIYRIDYVADGAAE